MKLPDNLKRIRKENNLSQEQLAEKLGVSRQAVSKWESGQSYPEMDKVLNICKLFNYNIDELLNENVKEVREETQSKKNLDKFVKDFFNYITKTADMFASMKFKQRVKCIIEQIIIALVIVIIVSIIGAIGGSIFESLFGWINNNVYSVLRSIVSSIYLIFSLVLGIVVLLHIFKVRYLDYYDIIVEKEEEKNNEANDDVEKSNNDIQSAKLILDNKREKIIIRDPKHSESKFLTAIVKLIMIGIKAFVGFCTLMFVFSLVCLIIALVCSFMFIKTGIIFVGALIGILAAILANVIIIELVYTFIVKRKASKTRIGICFLSAIIGVGLGIGLVLVGVKDFNYIETIDEATAKKTTVEFNMEDNTMIDTYQDIEFIEEDRDNILIEVEHSEYFEPRIRKTNNVISVYNYQTDSSGFELIRQNIDDINNKQIINYYSTKVYVHASKENIEKLEQNSSERARKYREYEQRISDLEDEITELEDTINNNEEKITELENTIDEKDSQIDSLEDTINEYRSI